MSWYDQEVKMEELVGVIFKSITVNEAKDEIIFVTDNDIELKMYHSQDCCEGVSIDDICGDLDDLLLTPITRSEEATNTGTGETKYSYEDGVPNVTTITGEWPEGVPLPEYNPESYTWTFYKFSTIKGSVTIRWYGSSNGYYSESVRLVDVSASEKKRNED